MITEGAVKYVKDKTVQTRRGPSMTYAILMDDEQWYNCGFKDPKVAKGDYVSLEYEVGAYGNDVKAVKPSTGPSGASQTPSGGGPRRKTFPIAEDDPDISMIRRSAAHLVATLYKDKFDRAVEEERGALVREMLWMCEEYWTPYFTGHDSDFHSTVPQMPGKLVREDNE